MSEEENPNLNSLTCFAHFILTGSASWALNCTMPSHSLAFGTFSFLIGHSLVGALNFGLPSRSKIIERLYEETSLIAEVIPLPLLTSQVYLLTKMPKEKAFIPACTAFLPILMDLFYEKLNDKIIDIVLAGNVFCLMHLAYTTDNPWIMAIIAVTAQNQFVFRRMAERYEVPKMDIVAVGLSFFCIFAVNCLSNI